MPGPGLSKHTDKKQENDTKLKSIITEWMNDQVFFHALETANPDDRKTINQTKLTSIFKKISLNDSSISNIKLIENLLHGIFDQYVSLYFQPKEKTTPNTAAFFSQKHSFSDDNYEYIEKLKKILICILESLDENSKKMLVANEEIRKMLIEPKIDISQKKGDITTFISVTNFIDLDLKKNNVLSDARQQIGELLPRAIEEEKKQMIK